MHIRAAQDERMAKTRNRAELHRALVRLLHEACLCKDDGKHTDLCLLINVGSPLELASARRFFRYHYLNPIAEFFRGVRIHRNDIDSEDGRFVIQPVHFPRVRIRLAVKVDAQSEKEPNKIFFL